MSNNETMPDCYLCGEADLDTTVCEGCGNPVCDECAAWCSVEGDPDNGGYFCQECQDD